MVFWIVSPKNLVLIKLMLIIILETGNDDLVTRQITIQRIRYTENQIFRDIQMNKYKETKIKSQETFG